MLPAFLTPIVTWIGRTMLVRFVVGSAAAGAGAVAASAATNSNSTSDLFDGLAWGEWAGQNLLNEAEIHWNDNKMGNGKPCVDKPAAGTAPSPCTPGSRQLEYYVSDYKGIWGHTTFRFKINWDYDGCNLTNLFFTPSVDFNTIRSAVTKTVIQQIRVEPTSDYKPADCGCNEGHGLITETGGTSGSGGAVIAEGGSKPCCCTPAVIKIIASVQTLSFGFISNDASTYNLTCIIAANGYGTITSDIQ